MTSFLKSKEKESTTSTLYYFAFLVLFYRNCPNMSFGHRSTLGLIYKKCLLFHFETSRRNFCGKFHLNLETYNCLEGAKLTSLYVICKALYFLQMCS